MTEITIMVPGPPVPKKRPRVVNGRTYTPPVTVEAERRVAWIVKTALPSDQEWPNSSLYGLRARFYCGRGSGYLVDGDNLCKTILDALNNLVWKDDRQVVDVHYIVERGCAEPRTELELWEIAA